MLGPHRAECTVYRVEHKQSEQLIIDLFAPLVPLEHKGKHYFILKNMNFHANKMWKR